MNIPYYIGCAFDDQDEMEFRKKKAPKKDEKTQEKNDDKEDR